MRALLLGAGGMLGRDLIGSAPGGAELVALTRAELDVTDGAAVEREVRAWRPEVIVNAAGYTQVDRAEAERDRAFAVNGVAPGVIGRAAALVGALVVHFSTDYVFGGRERKLLAEDDPTEPLSAYASSKLEGERRLAASGARYLIIRSQWLFGLHGRSFPRTMWERATANQPTRVVNDQFGRPTYALDLARATWSILTSSAVLDRLRPSGGGGKGGGAIVHIANSGIATWYDVARRIFELAGVPDLLSPCTTADYPAPARRPAWSVLDTTRHERATGGPLPSWEDALDRFLSALRSETPSLTAR